jgi:hypothetical protein
MKYSDLITLQDYFHPVFNLQNEAPNYWKQFIPTSQFTALLEKTLDAVSSNLPANRKSIWVQGTFGTGKSHAGAVVKHLLCDDVSEISGYIDDRIENSNLKSRLTNLRNEKCYFPVVLSGVEGAYNPHTFSLTLERTVKETLRKAGHQISVNSDFERAIELLETNQVLDIEKIINDTPELRIIATNKAEIVKKLKVSDIELYLVLEETLAKYSIQLSTGDIAKWFSEVETEIRNKEIADGLLLFWDEFTSVMDTIQSGLINILQKIAELSEKQNIYLYLISHRPSTAYGERGDDVRKMNDRFHIIQYKMEALTTYHIMAATLKKTEVSVDGTVFSYNEVRDSKMQAFNNLLSYLTDNASQQSIDDIKNLFPLHPYTSFLCSSLADQIGSANRSVFSFMYDRERGFLHFLKDKSAFDEKRLLTADSLWDFFEEIFNGDPNKYAEITRTYGTYKQQVATQGLPYEKVFKGILLLNAMRNRIGEVDKILPSEKNIKLLFAQEKFEPLIDEILNYLNKKQILVRDPLDNFLIETSTLPSNEINERKRNIESNYSDAIKILEYDPNHKQKIAKLFSDKKLVRCSELCYLHYYSDDYHIVSQLERGFKEPYSLHIALFLAMNETEKQAIHRIIQRVLAENRFQNIIFVVFAESLDADGVQRQRFVEYVAKQEVANNHNSNDQALDNQKKANQVVTNWLNRLNAGNYHLYFRTEKNIGTVNSVAQYINQNIGYKIFTCGYENLLEYRKQRDTFYKPQNSAKSAEAMLLAKDRDDCESRFSSSQYMPAKILLKNDDDYVVESSLEIKATAPENHPLVLVQKEVDKLLTKARKTYSSTFSLGDVLKPLCNVPFGLYSNIPNVALLAFALRTHKNELYEASVGTPLTTDNLRDKVVEFFKNGNSNKLTVRFGSKEEKELKDKLVDIFDLTKIPGISTDSIKQVHWGIRDYCTLKAKYPLWSLKYYENPSDDIKQMIDRLVEMTDEPKPEQIKQLLNCIKQNQLDLHRLLLTSTAFEEGFSNFVSQTEGVKIELSWWNELNNYLKTLPKDIGFWEEVDVRDKVKSFYISKLKPSATQQPPSTTQANLTPTPDNTLQSPVSEEKVKLVKTKISQANLPTPALKYILLQILEKYPITADLINENM